MSNTNLQTILAKLASDTAAAVLAAKALKAPLNASMREGDKLVDALLAAGHEEAVEVYGEEHNADGAYFQFSEEGMAYGEVMEELLNAAHALKKASKAMSQLDKRHASRLADVEKLKALL